MKKIVHLFPLALVAVILVLFSGCVSRSNYKKLKAENEKIKTELARTETELDSLKFGAERLYKEASFAFGEKNYSSSKKRARLVVEHHSGTNYAIMAKELIGKIDSIHAAKVAEAKAEKEALERNLNRNISKRYDEFIKSNIYETKRNTIFYPEDAKGKGFKVELCLAHCPGNGVKWFELETLYTGSDSIFYSRVILLGDNGTKISIGTYYPYKNTDTKNGKVREWSYNQLNKEEVLSINQSKTIKYRFDGKYQFTYTMTPTQRQAFNEIVERYKRL